MQSYAGSERQVNDAAAADPEQPERPARRGRAPSAGRGRARPYSPRHAALSRARCPGTAARRRPAAPPPPSPAPPVRSRGPSWAVSSATNAHDVARTGAVGLGLEPACRHAGVPALIVRRERLPGISIAFGGSSYPHGRQPTGRQPRVAHRVGDRRVAEKVLDQSRVGPFIGQSAYRGCRAITAQGQGIS